MPTIINIEKEKLIPNHQETARYLGYSKLSAPDTQIASLIEQAATQMHKIINPKAVFQDFELEITFPTENQNQENPIIKLKDTDSIKRFIQQPKKLSQSLSSCLHIGSTSRFINQKNTIYRPSYGCSFSSNRSNVHRRSCRFCNQSNCSNRKKSK